MKGPLLRAFRSSECGLGRGVPAGSAIHAWHQALAWVCSFSRHSSMMRCSFIGVTLA